LALDEQAHGAFLRPAAEARPPLRANVNLLPGFCDDITTELDLIFIVQDEPVQTGVRVPVLMLTEILERSGATCVKLEEPPTGL
jgi:hypothetical protein